MANQTLLAQQTTHPALNSHPIVFRGGKGPFLFDINNRKYIDFMNGKGAVILGHHPARLTKMVRDFLNKGKDVRTGFTEQIFSVSKLISDAVKCDKLAYFKTGTEAVKAAIHCAKSYSGKNIILSSGYHGYDPMWKFEYILGKPNKSGIIDFYFDLDLLESLVKKYRGMISAVIISPDPIYLSNEWYMKLKEIIKDEDFLLIADEVKVGFRYNFGLYIAEFDLKPDISIVSKAIANGYPISVVCGNEYIMRNCAYSNYTCFFDALTFFVAEEVIHTMSENAFYMELNDTSNKIISIMKSLITDYEIPINIRNRGSIFQFILPDEKASKVFYSESVKFGFIFYPGDNQCISSAFKEKELLIELKKNFSGLFRSLKKSELFNLNKKPTLEWEILTAWNLMDGLPSFKIPKKLKRKFLKELPE